MATIDLNHLSVFGAVGESASFSVAARRLGLPKSSVSRAVAKLEAAVGVRLVHRTTRHVALSTAGKALYEKTAPLLATLRQSIGDLPELEEQPSGRLRVTATIDFGAAVLAEVVARFVARYPGVEVELRLTNELVDLVAESIDVALRISSTRLKDSSLTAKKAGPVTLQLFAAPAYLARRGTPRVPRDLDGHEWVGFRAARAVRLEGPGGPIDVRPQGRITCDDMSFLRAAVLEGAGIGVLPAFLTHADVAAGRLVRLLPRWNMLSGYLWIVSPGARHVPRKVSAFTQLVLETMRASRLG